MPETRVHEVMPFGFADTTFQAAGGIKGIKRLIDTFFKLVDTLPQAHELRLLYPDDLQPSKEKLGRYLCGWMGGPKKYQEKYGKIKITQVHERIKISPEQGEIWLYCMHQAIDRQPYSERFAFYFKEQFKLTTKRIVESQNPS